MTSVKDQPWFKADNVQRVLNVMNGDGAETRVVGGAVRNALMGLAVNDIDMATTLEPEAVIARAKAHGMKPVPTGIDHGTVTVICNHQPFELTTLRTDVETFGRHAQVRFGTDWAEDAARRDLTINALYAGADGEVIDLVDGLADIETRTVRFIGDAELRIREDYLRILRFFRFFAWYGSGRPDAAGLKAAARARDGLSTLSAERIWAELKKILSAQDPSRALLWMRQTGVLTIILPESEKWGIDAITPLIATEEKLGWVPDPYLRLAAIIPPDEARVSAMASRLRMANAESARLKAFTRTPQIDDGMSRVALRQSLYRHGRDGSEIRLRLQLASARGKAAGGDLEQAASAARLSALLDTVTPWEKPVMPISGADVIAAGAAPGPAVGEILKALENEWVEGGFAYDRATLAARMETLVATWKP
ncbi:CCA tRNA nucleotidyltransferase [Martelella alba]|uniref:CCA tRNA nucleotidyltransferase n=1 Tax=Martelella alba TaxID=2590451 RepID=A0A506UFG9_9HYPH|nr:CCA tRNA nucleotidyltransferase [Martelella alba]TPW31715.1 CCA tRNA nucleotidyltransferase [Martelella alba]